MKHKIIVLFGLIFISSLKSQVGNVGINTANPRVKLDVKGSYKSSKIVTGSTPLVTLAEKDRYLLLNQSIVDDRIRRIDSSQPGAPGLASVITYKLTNINRDWIESFNTKINATDYSLMVMSAFFDHDVEGSTIAIPSFGVKNVGNEWVLYADYSELASTENGTWTIVCAVYSKTYVKIFPERGPFDLNNGTAGTDLLPILK